LKLVESILTPQWLLSGALLLRIFGDSKENTVFFNKK
jgi:hypothetical protein